MTTTTSAGPPSLPAPQDEEPPDNTLISAFHDLLQVLSEFVNAPVYEDSSEANEEGPSPDHGEAIEDVEQPGTTATAVLTVSTQSPQARDSVDDLSSSADNVAPSNSSTTSSLSDPCQPTPWRSALLSCLGAKPDEASKHLAVIPFFTGLLFTTSFLWTDVHWTAKGLQIALGGWSLGPCTVLLLYVPLARPRHNLHRIILYNHVLMPMFVVVMLIDVSLALVVLVIHLKFGKQDVAGLIFLALCSVHVLILALFSVEPAIRAYHHCASVPFYPFCLCYCCCPRCFRTCHRCSSRACCCRRCCCCRHAL